MSSNARSAVEEEFSPIFSSSRVTRSPRRRAARGTPRPLVLAGEDEERRREGAVGDPLLGAGDPVVASTRVRIAPASEPRARLGQRERGELLARRQRRHEALDLLLGAVVEDRQRARAGVHGDGHADARVGARELLEHEHVGEEVRPRAAVLLGHAHAHQARARRARRTARAGSGARGPTAAACGAIFSSANRRVRSRISRWSSVSSCRLMRAPPAARRRRPPARRGRDDAQLAAQTFEAHDLPPLLARHARQFLVRVDRHRMPDEAQHRQVGLGIAVRVGRGEVDPLARGEVTDRLRLALAIVERAALAAGVDAVDDLGDASRRRRRRSARSPSARPSPARRRCR